MKKGKYDYSNLSESGYRFFLPTPGFNKKQEQTLFKRSVAGFGRVLII